MTRKLLENIKHILPAVAFAHLLIMPAIAQSERKSSSKEPTTTATQSCDGALDIVPAKSMSFLRKRRPGKSETAPITEPSGKKTATTGKTVKSN